MFSGALDTNYRRRRKSTIGPNEGLPIASSFVSCSALGCLLYPIFGDGYDYYSVRLLILVGPARFLSWFKAERRRLWASLSAFFQRLTLIQQRY